MSNVEKKVAAWTSEPPAWNRADALALAVWTIAIVGFFWKAVTFQGAFFYFDITEINFAYRDFLAKELQQGRFSRWFPELYCGMPLFSESQAGYFHPLKPLLYPWLATWKAFNLDTVLSIWLTGLGAYLWLRRHARPVAALTGASVFGLSGFVWAHLIHTSMTNALTSVPFAVLGLEWAWSRGRLAGVAAGGLAIAFQVFAGHLQDTLLTILLLAVYTLFWTFTEPTWRGRFMTLALAGGVVGLGVTLSAIQWIPSKELLDRSPRAGGLTWQGLTYGSWSPELLPTLVIREAYGTRARDTDWMDGYYPYHEMNAYLGLTAIALAVIGAAAYRDRWVAFWLLLALLGSVLMLGKFTFLFDLAHRIPVLGSSRIPVRFHLWVSLAAAALAAVGVDRLSRPGEVRIRSAFTLVALMILGSIPILLYVYAPVVNEPTRWNLPYHIARYRWLGEEFRGALLRTGLLTVLGFLAIHRASRSISPKARIAWTCILPCVVIADLLGSHRHDAPTIDPSYWTVPPLSAQKLKADPSVIRVFGIADRSAGEPGYASEPIDFMAVRDTLDWSLPPVWGLATSRGETPIIPRRLLTYTDHAKQTEGRFDIESVSHWVRSRKASSPLLGPGEVAGNALIFKNPNVLPRVRRLGRPIYVANEDEAAAALDRLDGTVRERIIVEDPSRPLLANEAKVDGTARIVREIPEEVVVETEGTTPAYLLLADTYDPGWSVTLDGKEAAIRPAYSAFRSVYVEPGHHTLIFRYRPAGFALGASISLAGIALTLGCLAWPLRVAVLGESHRVLGWPARWPALVIVSIVFLIAVSAVSVHRDGSVGIQSRWRQSFHPFTWGAGIDAMRYQTKSP